MFNGQFKSLNLDAVRAPHARVSFESLSGDRRRTKAKVLDVNLPSPVKKKQRMGKQSSSAYSDILEAALANFGPDGFVMVSDSCQTENVEALFAAAVSRSRRRYTTSVRFLNTYLAFHLIWVSKLYTYRINPFLNGVPLRTNIWQNSCGTRAEVILTRTSAIAVESLTTPTTSPYFAARTAFLRILCVKHAVESCIQIAR